MWRQKNNCKKTDEDFNAEATEVAELEHEVFLRVLRVLSDLCGE